MRNVTSSPHGGDVIPLVALRKSFRSAEGADE
jgi:hypothetical protein